MPTTDHFISLRGVHVRYPLHSDDTKSLKKLLAKRFEGRAAPSITFINALKGISFDVKSGERVGIIGANGAGKSTLLKVVAGVFPPTEGSINIMGRISPLLDLGVGFDPDLSGFDNIDLRLRLMGLDKRQIADLRPSIVEFSGLTDSIWLPMRTYSSGMFVRLAFSVITSVKPDILVLDEFVSAGDMAFAARAEQRMEALLDKGSIVVVASHALDAIVQHCPRTIMLSRGQMVMDGPTSEVVQHYRDSVLDGLSAQADA